MSKNVNYDLSKKHSYVFSVPARYTYEVDADTEEEARKILEEVGGLDLMGELEGPFEDDYKNAKLIETWASE